jgi:hypothetical protein
MKSIVILVLSAFLALIGCNPGAAMDHQVHQATTYILYPPQNLNGNAVECSSYLQWQIPQQPGGTVPQGLIGYYIYREGVQIAYIPDATVITYYDYMPEPGEYSYTVTANYDLTSYGFPGQFEQSTEAGPAVVFVVCDIVLPFQEYWDQGTFAFNNWQFTPSQLNWSVSTSQGNPLPTAQFTGVPVNLDYANTMYTPALSGQPWNCGTMYLEFDYNLDDIAANGSEKLSASWKTGNDWVQVFEVSNNGSTGWIHQKIDITQVNGASFRIAFKAGGTNSASIAAWYVDNIVVSHECASPVACAYTQSANTIMLSWEPPGCDSLQYIVGYNVYRTLQPNGQPPLIKLNASPVTTTFYHDILATWYPSGELLYVITDIQRDPITQEILCEAPCDTLHVDYITGVDIHQSSDYIIFPNPASDHIRVRPDLRVERYEICDLRGNVVLSGVTAKEPPVIIPVSSLHRGLYFITLITSGKTTVVKLAISDKEKNTTCD